MYVAYVWNCSESFKDGIIWLAMSVHRSNVSLFPFPSVEAGAVGCYSPTHSKTKDEKAGQDVADWNMATAGKLLHLSILKSSKNLGAKSLVAELSMLSHRGVDEIARPSLCDKVQFGSPSPPGSAPPALVDWLPLKLGGLDWDPDAFISCVPWASRKAAGTCQTTIGLPSTGGGGGARGCGSGLQSLSRSCHNCSAGRPSGPHPPASRAPQLGCEPT